MVQGSNNQNLKESHALGKEIIATRTADGRRTDFPINEHYSHSQAKLNTDFK